MLDDAVNDFDSFQQSIKRADGSLQGAGHVPQKMAGRQLAVVNNFLYKAWEVVPAFSTGFQAAFQNFLDSISEDATAEVNGIFSGVQENVSSIVWSVRTASRELTFGSHEAITLVADKLGMQIPNWRQPPPVEQSAALRAPATALLAALLALGVSQPRR
mmetsp:Transcript_84799/g.240324  ORF Transcript_84799/g.240324 Transcript_84799/m.240324 type:complete len:159 (+) Transcript_84799:1-477(+)